MTEPAWTDLLSAWSTFATAVLTLILVCAAIWAGIAALHTLKASRQASAAAMAAAETARAANEQARRDSIQQTRPYVYAEILPGLASSTSYDLKITNTGKSAARDLTLNFTEWPEHLDDVATSVQTLFETPRTLPPGSGIRAWWRLEGNFDDGTTEAGMPKTGRISVLYSSDDVSQPQYRDECDVMIGASGLWPRPEEGPRPDHLKGDSLKFYRLGQALLRRVGELGR